ncbi:MAG: glycosyltransferase family 2 protein [Chloroflexota bacterium]
MIDLAIIIVNWNVRDLLAACLRTVQADLAGSNVSGQVWVVDNASTDGSVELVRREFPQVKLISSNRNLGFAAGNNAALQAMGFPAGQASDLPEAVLLLNPDTEVHAGALPTLLGFFRRMPTAGIAGARLVYGDGSFQHSGFDFPGLWQLAIELLPRPGRLVESRLNGRYPPALYQRGAPFRVGHPLGAAMCVRGEAIRQAGLLDEQYHMYVEEIDWARRISAAGWTAYCVPAAVVTHLGGQSTGQIRIASFTNLWTSRYRFYRQHYHPLKVRLAAQIVRAGMRRRAGQDLQAARRGELTLTELSERQQCYQRISTIWQGQEIDD